MSLVSKIPIDIKRESSNVFNSQNFGSNSSNVNATNTATKKKVNLKTASNNKYPTTMNIATPTKVITTNNVLVAHTSNLTTVTSNNINSFATKENITSDVNSFVCFQFSLVLIYNFFIIAKIQARRYLCCSKFISNKTIVCQVHLNLFLIGKCLYLLLILKL